MHRRQIRLSSEESAESGTDCFDIRTCMLSAKIGYHLAVNIREGDLPDKVMIGRAGSVREVVLDIRGSNVQLEVDVGLRADAG